MEGGPEISGSDAQSSYDGATMIAVRDRRRSPMCTDGPVTSLDSMSNQRSTDWSADVEAVYKTEARQLWAMFYAHCTDADRAYDAVQESFFRLQRYQGEPIRDVRAWLLRVGQNWLRDVARSKSSGVRSTEHLDKMPGGTEEPSFILADRETQQLVRDVLGRLREDDRSVLILRYGLGWASNRIAAVLNIKSTAVDMRLSRARKRMAELLEEAGVPHD